jgi:hypothetical protein
MPKPGRNAGGVIEEPWRCARVPDRDGTPDCAERAGKNEAGFAMKLKRRTFAATFFLACLAAMELEGVVLEKI